MKVSEFVECVNNRDKQASGIFACDLSFLNMSVFIWRHTEPSSFLVISCLSLDRILNFLRTNSRTDTRTDTKNSCEQNTLYLTIVILLETSAIGEKTLPYFCNYCGQTHTTKKMLTKGLYCSWPCGVSCVNICLWKARLQCLDKVKYRCWKFCSLSYKSQTKKKHVNINLLKLCGDVEENPGPNPTKGNLMLLTQNCRGLNDNNKLRLLLTNMTQIVGKNNYILALQETYLLNDNNLKWYKNGTLNYAFTAAESLHSAGCITFFKETDKILETKNIDAAGHGHVVVVEGLYEKPRIVANIYSPVRSLPREHETFYERLTSVIEELELKYLMYEPNLVVLGDFNLPLESELNVINADKLRALNLAEYLKSLGLIDCWKKDDVRITFRTAHSCLDRILYRINGTFAEKLTTDWTFLASDHCLVKLELEKERHKNTRRTVSLPTYLLSSKEDAEKIERGLADFYNMCGDSWDASTKLEFLKIGLRTVVGECVKERNRREREEMELIQKELERRMVTSGAISLLALEQNRNEIEELFAKRNSLLEKKSEGLAKKAKTRWFYEGERSNKYFLNLLRCKHEMTNITKLETRNSITEDKEEIKIEIRKFYKNLYEAEGDTEIDNSFYQHITKVKDRDAEKVVEKLTKEEIYHTLASCKDSAPGPDGIPYSYYKRYWRYFGEILTQAWNESIESKTLPASHRSSLLSLLQKEGKDLTKITNWRPITLSNCDHKIITKCYAKRLTDILCNVLHPNQTAYLPGKQIQDNLRVIDIVNKQAVRPIIGALDAKNAFDSVNHDYIRHTLDKYGLGSFIPIFDLLYKEQRVDIALNGDVIEGYMIKNGVKQGDSLSCILFILSIDPLIWNIENNNNIGRLYINDVAAPKILAYADDVTCLTDTSSSLKNIFKEYERLSKASKLVLNADKTEILYSRPKRFKFKYLGEIHQVASSTEVKINGLIFDSNSLEM